jgi:hypothetical protein
VERAGDVLDPPLAAVQPHLEGIDVAGVEEADVQVDDLEPRSAAAAVVSSTMKRRKLKTALLWARCAIWL